MTAEVLKGVAVVTGAATGIGRGLAEAFLAEGMTVVVADIDEAGLRRTSEELRAGGGNVLAVRTNVADPASVDALADAAFDVSGSVQVLCNNAGVVGPAGIPLWNLDLDEWRRVMDINFWGVLHGIRAFLPRMVAPGTPCHVVNTASMMGVVSASGVGSASDGRTPHYLASKHAVVGLTEALRDQAASGYPMLGVSMLCPGPVETDLIIRERERVVASGGDAPPPDFGKRELRPGTVRIQPAAVAELVLKAIRSDIFYVMPNPGSGDRVEAHFKGVLAALTPGDVSTA